MSGIEIAIGVAAASSLLASGVGAYSQISTANEVAKLQADDIREQQIQLRLQENQNSIERMKKLQSVLATEEVSFGIRNIGYGSATTRAITAHDVSNFYEDEDADRLNYGAKQLALARQSQINSTVRKAAIFNAYTGVVKQGANTALTLTGLAGGGVAGASAGGAATGAGAAGAATAVNSAPKQFNLNR